jgi:hypothetical protein
MNAKELRIGNLIEINEELRKENSPYEPLICPYFEVEEINKDGEVYLYSAKENVGIYSEIEELKPIPITLELLDKLGFTIENKPNGDIEYSYKEYRYSLIYKENYDGYLFCDDDIVLRDLEFIHELQNIYFALIQIEIKLKND